jgi:hypothetical protein
LHIPDWYYRGAFMQRVHDDFRHRRIGWRIFYGHCIGFRPKDITTRFLSCNLSISWQGRHRESKH